jgi:integrase/recombinase XerC
MSEFEIQLGQFFETNDLSQATMRAIRSDLRKFVSWFQSANGEAFDAARITVRDVADWREHLRNVRRQGIATVNRGLVSARRFLGYLVSTGSIQSNPAKNVKELRRTPTAPRGLTVAQTRRIMREVEIRQDRRAGATLGLMLYGGLRVSDVVGLEMGDITITPRSGQVLIRNGKGGRQRIVPLSIEARRLLSEYLEVRPPSECTKVFVGERGGLTADGVRNLCSKYAALTGIAFTPHSLRHTFSHRFLEQSGNDLVALAQLLGHSNIQTVSIYCKQSEHDLQEKVEHLRYG